MSSYPRSVARLIDALERLPSIGPKSAQRLALWLLREPAERILPLAEALAGAAEKVRCCDVCGFFSEDGPCAVCRDHGRHADMLCVVADARDLLAIEETAHYRGKYHVLQGVLSPIDGIGPEDLTVPQLLTRVGDGSVNEVILALNPTPEGDTTAAYLARLLKQRGIRVTRPALGLPVGGDLDYADRVTIERALDGRVEL
ncbi:MAG: recombination protein RecR [Armatimonadetes bacterium]|nr:recombination protein RecR [Armatimonadota bacterium]